jgi:cell division protein FtsB
MTNAPPKRWAWWIGVLLAILFLVGNQGFRQLLNRLREKRRVEQSLANLHLENQQLSHELSLLQQDPTYTEYLIRKDLGYVKKGEVEYRFLKKTQDPGLRAQRRLVKINTGYWGLRSVYPVFDYTQNSLFWYYRAVDKKVV